MRVLMYHYVRPWSANAPYLKCLHIDDFQKQIEYIGKTGHFLTQAEFYNCLNGSPVPDDGILLTFDDGFAEHAAFVAPFLASKGLWGQFFVTSTPYVSGKMLAVHRIHMLLAKGCGPAALERAWEILKTDEFLGADGIEICDFEEGASAYLTQNVGPDVTFKRLLNYKLSITERDRLLDILIPEFLGDERDYVNSLYASVVALKEMKQMGMSLGGHSVSHPPLATLSEYDQRWEITENLSFLKEYQLLDVNFGFAYPYGTEESVSDLTASILREHGCDFAYTTQPRQITSQDIALAPLFLPRLDCNLFPHGQVRPVPDGIEF